MTSHEHKTEEEDLLQSACHTLDASQETTSLLATGACSWLTVILSSTSTLRSLFSELLSIRSVPHLHGQMGLFLPVWGTLYLPLSNFYYSLPISPACPGQAEWQYSLLVCQALLPGLCHQQTCWWVHSIPSWRLLMNISSVLRPVSENQLSQIGQTWMDRNISAKGFKVFPLCF